LTITCTNVHVCRQFKVERGAEAALLVRLDVGKLSKLGRSSEWWQKPVTSAEAGSAEEQAEAAAAAAAAGVMISGLLQHMQQQQQQMHRPAVTVVSANGLLEFVAGMSVMCEGVGYLTSAS
jgi:hypothetical protein